jgi:hypothetical protein
MLLRGRRRRGTPLKVWQVALMVAIALGIALLLYARPWVADPVGPIQHGVASIMSVQAGWHGKWTSIYVYRVRLTDGGEGAIRLRDSFAPGTRLRLAYARDTRGGILVFAYERCGEDCGPDAGR